MKDFFTITLSVSDGFKVIDALREAENLYAEIMNCEHASKGEREDAREEQDAYRWLQIFFGEKMKETGAYDY
jgi:hypothetical protein